MPIFHRLLSPCFAVFWVLSVCLFSSLQCWMSKIPVVVGGSTFQAPLRRWQPQFTRSWRASPWPPRSRPPAWPLTLGDGTRSWRRGNRDCLLALSPRPPPQRSWQFVKKILSKESLSRELSPLLKLATKRKTDPAKLFPQLLSILLRNGKLLTLLLRPHLLTLSQKQKQQRSGECLWFRSLLSLSSLSSLRQPLVFVLVLLMILIMHRRPLPPPLPGRPAIAPNKPSLNGHHWATRVCKLSTVIRQHSHHHSKLWSISTKFSTCILLLVSNFFKSTVNYRYK